MSTCPASVWAPPSPVLSSLRPPALSLCPAPCPLSAESHLLTAKVTSGLVLGAPWSPPPYTFHCVPATVGQLVPFFSTLMTPDTPATFLGLVSPAQGSLHKRCLHSLPSGSLSCGSSPVSVLQQGRSDLAEAGSTRPIHNGSFLSTVCLLTTHRGSKTGPQLHSVKAGPLCPTRHLWLPAPSKPGAVCFLNVRSPTQLAEFYPVNSGDGSGSCSGERTSE